MKPTSTPGTHPDNPKLRNVRIEIGQHARDYVTGEQRITMVPLTIRRKQNSKVMTPPPGEQSVLGTGGEDIAMIRTQGLSMSVKVEQGWVAEVLRMTTLAPDIIEAVLDGQQPRHINLQTLRERHDPLPRDC